MRLIIQLDSLTEAEARKAAMVHGQILRASNDGPKSITRSDSLATAGGGAFLLPIGPESWNLTTVALSATEAAEFVARVTEHVIRRSVEAA
jgi:hypothetical protein